MKNFTRRRFLKNGATFLSAMSIVPLRHGLCKAIFSSDAIYRFSVGKARCSILKDFVHAYQTEEFFSEASSEVETLFDAHQNIQDGKVHSPYDAMLIRMNGQNILIDTGIGFYKNPVTLGDHEVKIEGQLQTLLKEENLTPADVDLVIISHFHPDHIGGIYSEEGMLNFTNAQFVVGKKEWDFWHSSKAESLPPLFNDFIKTNITPLKDSDVKFLEEDHVSIVPGLSAIHAEGHTPGHLVFMLESEGEKLLYAADTFLHPIHIEHLEVQTVYDFDHDLARKSREKVLKLALENEALVHAFHFEFPGLGHVTQKGSDWQWEYIKNL